MKRKLIELEQDLTDIINEKSDILDQIYANHRIQFCKTYPKPGESPLGLTKENIEKLETLSSQLRTTDNDVRHLKRSRGIIRRYIKQQS